MEKHNWHGKAEYEIKVYGNLEDRWSDWFEGWTIKSDGSVTTLSGIIEDQPALHGLLVRIRDLGLPIISVTRIDASKDKACTEQS